MSAFLCLSLQPQAAALAERIKARSPKTKVYVGGPQVNLSPNAVRERFPIFDKLTLGHELVAAGGIAGRPTSDISPYLDFSLLPHPLASYAINTFTALGCPFGCHYCADGRAPKVCVSDDAMLSRMSALPPRTLIHIFDSVFGYSAARALAVCKNLQRLQHPFVLSCDMRAEMITEEPVREMQKAGFREIRLGIESADEELLQKNGRTLAPQRCLDAVKIIRETSDIYITLYSVTGLPGFEWCNLYRFCMEECFGLSEEDAVKCIDISAYNNVSKISSDPKNAAKEFLKDNLGVDIDRSKEIAAYRREVECCFHSMMEHMGRGGSFGTDGVSAKLLKDLGIGTEGKGSFSHWPVFFSEDASPHANDEKEVSTCAICFGVLQILHWCEIDRRDRKTQSTDLQEYYQSTDAYFETICRDALIQIVLLRVNGQKIEERWPSSKNYESGGWDGGGEEDNGLNYLIKELDSTPRIYEREESFHTYDFFIRCVPDRNIEYYELNGELLAVTAMTKLLDGAAWHSDIECEDEGALITKLIGFFEGYRTGDGRIKHYFDWTASESVLIRGRRTHRAEQYPIYALYYYRMALVELLNLLEKSAAASSAAAERLRKAG